jgi:hypothetical protein
MRTTVAQDSYDPTALPSLIQGQAYAKEQFT